MVGCAPVIWGVIDAEGYITILDPQEKHSLFAVVENIACL